MIDFKKQLAAASAEIKSNVDKAVRSTAIELLGELVRKTPVGNPGLWKGDAPAGYVGGRLRGNWQVQVNSADTSTIDTVDSIGNGTISKGISAIKGYSSKDKAIFISNNLPYAERVEEGWSEQAPAGMMKVSVEKFNEIVVKQARRLNK